MTTEPIGLAAHERILARELSLLGLPARAWLQPRLVDGRELADVAIVGAGLCGLCAAASLMFLGIRRVIVLDRAPEGLEGPWLTYARMRTLRTRKEITGPALGVPALTPRAWFEAQHGAAAWAALERIPRATWMEYLQWYRRVLSLPVSNDGEVTAIEPCPDGLVRLDLTGSKGAERMLARRVVLATGLGAPALPAIAHTVSRRFWAHAADPIDFAGLAGKRIGVVGSGASAMDNAATALEAGSASVDLLIRRADIPRIDKFTGIGSKGMAHGFAGLPEEVKWRFLSHGLDTQLPPPRHSVLRVSRHPNARFFLASPIVALAERDGQLEVTTPRARHSLDFLIFSTGFDIDPAARPELAAIAPHIRRWSDGAAPAGEEAHGLAASPDLGPGFTFRERVPGCCPGLAHIASFNGGAILSHGKLTSGIPAVSDGAQRLARALARSLFVEDRERLYADFADYATPELTGDEWQDAGAEMVADLAAS